MKPKKNYLKNNKTLIYVFLGVYIFKTWLPTVITTISFNFLNPQLKLLCLHLTEN